MGPPAVGEKYDITGCKVPQWEVDCKIRSSFLTLLPSLGEGNWVFSPKIELFNRG